MKFTREEVLRQVKEEHEGIIRHPLDDCPVKEAWLELADTWLADGSNEYQTDGFKGWNERTPEEILCDFHLNGLLVEPLSDEEFDRYISSEEFDPNGANGLTECECDNTHQQNDTVCMWCWSHGRRHWNDPEVSPTYSFDEIIERVVKAMRSMEGQEIADLCNREFGMGIKYNGDSVFEQEQE